MSYAIITGASKGLGKAISEELASRGYDLLLVARSENLLEAAATELKKKYSINVFFFPCDLTLPGAPQKVYDWCNNQNFEINILINNAGYAVWGLFETRTLEDQLNLMQLNMNALVALSHLFIPTLKKNKKAWLLNVSSTAAFQAVPTMAVYSASKAFVLTFTRALNFELKTSPVHVSCLIPGAVETHFMERAKMDAMKSYAEKFNMSPQLVAKIAVNAMFKNKLEIIPGFSNRFSAIGTKLLPKKLVEKIAAGIYLDTLKKSSRL
ncbi:MAG: SDR family oxidoreductase [Bacteroidia bacterium]